MVRMWVMVIRCSFESEIQRLLWKISGPNPLPVIRSTQPLFTKQALSDLGVPVSQDTPLSLGISRHALKSCPRH